MNLLLFVLSATSKKEVDEKEKSGRKRSSSEEAPAKPERRGTSKGKGKKTKASSTRDTDPVAISDDESEEKMDSSKTESKGKRRKGKGKNSHEVVSGECIVGRGGEKVHRIPLIYLSRIPFGVLYDSSFRCIFVKIVDHFRFGYVESNQTNENVEIKGGTLFPRIH